MTGGLTDGLGLLGWSLPRRQRTLQTELAMLGHGRIEEVSVADQFHSELLLRFLILFGGWREGRGGPCEMLRLRTGCQICPESLRQNLAERMIAGSWPGHYTYKANSNFKSKHTHTHTHTHHNTLHSSAPK